ncbi:MAG: Ger(x)C family spore germination protein [Lutisporaceae bacterium]
MKKKLLALIIMLCLLTTGCFSYRDINKLLIVVTTIIDIDENNNIIIYLEVFKPYRSEQIAGGKGQRLTYKSKGETILEAIRDLNLGTSLKLNFTQNKVLIFTKRAAEKGLKNFLDFLNRDQEYVLRQYMYIYEQDPEQLLKNLVPEEEYLGIYLFEIPINQAASAKSYVTRIDEYLNNRLIGNEIDVLPIIILSTDHLDSKVRFQSSAILKDDKMIGKIDFDETAIYNLLTETIKSGTLLVTGEDKNIMTLEIVGTKLKTDIVYDGDTLKLKKKIDIRTTFASSQKSLELNQAQVREKIIETAEKNVEEKCQKLFLKWKEEGTDIFEITKKFERVYKHQKLKVSDIIEITELEVDVNVTIEGSSDVTDYID